jgi:3-dehydroquinate synthase
VKITRKFSVEYDHRLVFTRDVFGPANEELAHLLGDQPARLFVFIDSGLAEADQELEDRIAKWIARHPSLKLEGVCIVPGGEACKRDLSVVTECVHKLLAAKLCRHSFALIIGGGAVLDAVGLACTLFHRGLNQIRLPSTLLAQDDSGVGVKNAVNLFGVKNLVGTFSPPWAVINDAAFLDHLGPRQIRAGAAEAFKVALIKDADFFARIEELAPLIVHQSPQALEELARRAAILHMDHICFNGDPFEKGSSRPLDFGHWSAHCLEVLSEHSLLHGEAVAIGMAIDLHIAADLGLLPLHDRDRALTLLSSLGYQLWHPALTFRDESGKLKILKGLSDFQEHLGGQLTVAMPIAIGHVIDINEIPVAAVERAVAALASKF